MSAKNRDQHNRWRNHTVAFRVSHEESAEIDRLVALSGLSKQDYIIRRLTNREVVVNGNPRVHKALKTQMEQLYLEFQRLCNAGEISPETLHVLEYVSAIYDGMKTEGTKECPTTKQGE